MGIHRGVLTQFQENRHWLLKIHCTNHRIELAAKKAINESVYTEVEAMYLTIYFFLNNSGRFKSECRQLAEAEDVDYKELPKIHGTRFIGHKLSGMKNLLMNWPIYRTACENAIAAAGPRAYKNPTKAKIMGIFQQFRDYRMLMLTATYTDVLEKATPISKVFESERILPSDVQVNIKRTILELQDLSDSACTPEEALDSHISKYLDLKTMRMGKRLL